LFDSFSAPGHFGLKLAPEEKEYVKGGKAMYTKQALHNLGISAGAGPPNKEPKPLPSPFFLFDDSIEISDI
jgi:hypothetical protein